MAKLDGFTEEKLAEIFAYLDDLRESGATNMYGAASYLVDDFDMEVAKARAALGAWMNTFSHDLTPEIRAATALAA